MKNWEKYKHELARMLAEENTARDFVNFLQNGTFLTLTAATAHLYRMEDQMKVIPNSVEEIEKKERYLNEV